MPRATTLVITARQTTVTTQPVLMAVQLMANAEIKPNAQFLWSAPSAAEFSEVFSALSSLLCGAKSNALLRIVPSTNPYSPRKLFR